MAKDITKLLSLTGSSQQSPYVYHFTTEAGRIGIQEAGVVFPSADGFTYFTDVPYVRGELAQARLALRSIPTGYFAFKRNEVIGLTYRGIAQPLYGQPGGAPEYVVPGPVPLDNAIWTSIGE